MQLIMISPIKRERSTDFACCWMSRNADTACSSNRRIHGAEETLATNLVRTEQQSVSSLGYWFMKAFTGSHSMNNFNHGYLSTTKFRNHRFQLIQLGKFSMTFNAIPHQANIERIDRRHRCSVTNAGSSGGDCPFQYGGKVDAPTTVACMLPTALSPTPPRRGISFGWSSTSRITPTTSLCRQKGLRTRCRSQLTSLSAPNNRMCSEHRQVGAAEPGGQPHHRSCHGHGTP